MDNHLELSGIVKSFNGFRALDGLDLVVGQGELRCLIGPNGAGKSTFFKCLTGQYKPTSGTIRLREHDVTGWDSFAIARQGVGIKTQVPSVFDGLSVRDSVTISARRRYGAILARKRTADVLGRIGIEDIADKPIGLLSHGSRQLVELATVVASEPDLIILDEPTAGMTAEETARTAALIRQLNERHAIVVVEHDMQFIRSIAKTVTVFHQGRVLIEDRVDIVMGDPVVRDVYLGKDPIRPATGRVLA
jgi:branched-chain amino acid transport system ATP-binding protein